MTHIEDYQELIGAEALDRILQKANRLRGMRVAHVNATYYGGGVAELLSSLVPLMQSAGIPTEWRVIQGPPGFFEVTKKIHNALQGGDVVLDAAEKQLYEEAARENAQRQALDHDRVVIHDPQPLPLIEHYRRQGPWVWHCHVDLSDASESVWNYLSPCVEAYDAVVLSLEEYRRKIDVPQRYFMPAIDPFSYKNQSLSEGEIAEHLRRYDIPTDVPLVVQVSRFDRWKDPQGVIDAFKQARQEVDATLVLLGNIPRDDPEGKEVYESLQDSAEERILILPHGDDADLVNALQHRADVVLQKSIREGFGLTVTEAMWKGRAVIGGNAGGIRYQIEDGENGFLVSSVDEAARRIVELIKDPELRERLGNRARETVKERFLMSRLFESYMDVLSGFETRYELKTTGEQKD